MHELRHRLLFLSQFVGGHITSGSNQKAFQMLDVWGKLGTVSTDWSNGTQVCVGDRKKNAVP